MSGGSSIRAVGQNDTVTDGDAPVRDDETGASNTPADESWLEENEAEE